MHTIVYGLNAPAKLFIKSAFNIGSTLFASTSGDEQFEGEQAMSILDLAAMPPDKVSRIAVCSTFFSEICGVFKKHNIDLGKVYFFDHTRTLLLSQKDVLAPKIAPNEVLYAVYDLSTHLACFDVLNFAVLAEVERKRLGKKYIHFLIAHDRTYNNPRSTILFHEHHDHAWRVNNILKAAFMCIPTQLAISEFPFKEDLEVFLKEKPTVFPNDFKTNFLSPPINTLSLKSVKDEHDLSVLCAPPNAKKIVTKFLTTIPDDLKPIVITLREYDSQLKRNSDIAQWGRFLSDLDLSQYYPIIVRDSYHSSEPPDPRLSQFAHFPQASIDFTVRLALYEKAYLNMGVSCGPNYAISFIRGAKSIIFQMIDEDNPANSSLTAVRSGLDIGKDFFFNDSEYQKTIWQKDDYTQLKSAFEALIDKIKSKNIAPGGKNGP
jgi:hypothetical protein